MIRDWREISLNFLIKEFEVISRITFRVVVVHIFIDPVGTAGSRDTVHLIHQRIRVSFKLLERLVDSSSGVSLCGEDICIVSVTAGVRSDSDIASLDDLADKIVAVQKDSSGLAALEENEALTATFADLIEVDSYLNAMMELESGAVDAIVMDEIVARYEIQSSGKDFTVLDEAVASEEYGVGFNLGNTELRDQVQATLEEMAADGTLARISEQWFGTDVTTIGK